MTTIPVGVIEDHPLYRAALAHLLSDAPGFDLDAVAESVAQFTARRVNRNSVVLLDLSLPGVRDAAAVMAVVRLGHRVLVLSAQAGRARVLGALAAGASGYLCKNADGDEILRAVTDIAAGRRYLPAALSAFALDSTPATVELSVREADVLARVAAGDRDQDIALALRISVRTVGSYLDRIRDKTGLRRRPSLTRYAIEHGLTHSRQLSA